MEAWGLTDPGNIRNENQDSFRIEPLGEEALLTVVCDGMGGARSGSVAGRLACEVFTEEIKRSFSPNMTPAEAERVIRSAASLANISVFEHSQLSEEYNGMGTTLVACLLYPKANMVLNVGDSRAYLIDSDGIRCITRDHSVVEMMVQRGELKREEAKSYPGKNLITRAIGTEKTVSVDVFRIPVQKGDNLLLCSDGLSNFLSDQELLFEIVHGLNKADCCRRLLDIVMQRGAPDNVTAILISV